MYQTALRILRELKPFKKRLTIVALTGVILSGVTAQTTVFMKTLMDGLQAGKPEQILQTAGYIVILGFIGALARYAHYFHMNFTGELVAHRLRSRLQSHFMDLNLTFHSKYASGSGGLISRILSDISMVQTGLRLFADFFREPLSLLLLLGYLFYLDWRLTLAILVFAPVIGAGLRSLSRSVKKYSHRGQAGLDNIVSVVKESLDGVRVIQSFNLEKEMEGRFQTQFAPYLEARKKIHARIEINGPISEFVATLIMVTILVYMTFEVIAGRSTWGDLIGYLVALLALSKPIKVLQDSAVRFQETLASGDRIYSIFDEQRRVNRNHQGLDFPQTWQKIEFRDVSFRYEEKWVLKDVSLTVRRGQMIALVGASGSGKSTLVNLLERFYEPTKGSILIDEIPIEQIRLEDLRRHIGLVTQDVFLFNDSIEYNIESGDFTRQDPGAIRQAAVLANASDFIDSTPEGFKTRAGERGNLFSGGEKQRISIARAFYKNAPILILDEATSALDSANEREVQKGLDHLMEGRTSIVIAHRLSTIFGADMIYVFREGEIIESGTHQKLWELQGSFYSLCKMQGIASNVDI